MKSRYQRLDQKDIYEALNRVRNAFLAARDGTDVDKIMNGILTYDEKLKIGRRILIAEYLTTDHSIEYISILLKVGRNTVMHVKRRLEKYQDSFQLIEKRKDFVEKEYKDKKYRFIGGSELVIKRKEYTGFKRSAVKRR